MIIDIQHRCSDFNSYRAARVKSLFNAESGCNWQHTAELPLEGRDWKIGLIVGPSGSGKTSIGNKIFNKPIHDLYAGWDNNKPVIDCIAPDGDFNVVTGALSAVGLGDVPAWLRPFNVLSNGEKFRAGLARLVCERPEQVVVDEFTSVIDRQVAKVGASAFAKTWRKGNGQIVLLSCHYDIIEWLQPDWVYDTSEARFYNRDCLRQRPEICVDIYKVSGHYWKYFELHHYLKLPRPVCAEYYIGVVDGKPVCHLSTTPFFQVKAYRAMRFVVLPEWQGIGIGTAFLNEICHLLKQGKGRGNHPYCTYFKTSHPRLCNSLRHSPQWVQIDASLYGSNKKRNQESLARSGHNRGAYGGHFRATQSFKYIGE